MNSEIKLLGGAVKGGKQIGIFWEKRPLFGGDGKYQNYLLIRQETYDLDEDLIDKKETKIEIPVGQISLLRASTDIEKVKQVFEDIMTNKYPSPIQLKYLQFYVDNPDDLLTEAVINVCKRNDCLCPLFFSSLSCVEFVSMNIGDKFVPKELVNKKCVSRIIAFLRNKMSLEEFSGMLSKMAERMKQDAMLKELSGYR